MKKIKKVLTISLAVLLMGVSLSACDTPTNSSCKHTYTWSANDYTHQKVYTCGCAFPDIAQEHADDDNDGLCDVCGYCVEDKILFFDVIGELKQSDLKKIETAKYAGSISPDAKNPVEHKTTALAEDIESVYGWLKGLSENITPITDQEAQVDGGGEVVFTISLSQGTLEISSFGRNYLAIDGKYYAQEGKIPDIVGESVTYTFESYGDEAKLYIDGENVKEYTFAFDNLVCARKEFDKTARYPYELVTSFGRLYVYDGKHFIRNGVAYEIIGELDFSRLFADFPYPDYLSFETRREHNDAYVEGQERQAVTVLRTVEEFNAYRAKNFLTAVYTEEFFLDKVLVAVEKETWNGAITWGVERVQKKDGNLQIYLQWDDGGMDGASVMGTDYLWIALDKNEFSGMAENVVVKEFDGQF